MSSSRSRFKFLGVASRCERCESSEGKREDAWMDGFACPVPKCGGLCPPMSREGNKIPMPGDLLTCDKCGATRCAWEAKREATAVGDILGVSEAGIDGHFDSTTSMEDLEQARLRATRCLHRGNWMMAEILAALVSVGLDLEVRHGDMGTFLGDTVGEFTSLIK